MDNGDILVIAHFGGAWQMAEMTLDVIPEPATLSLMVFSGFCVLRARRIRL